MIITLFNKTKAHNSTEVLTGGNQVNGVLKEDCSIVNPVVKLKQDSISANITQYSYAYIAEFGRYYFVTDKIYVGGLWELHMHCDVLATWRSTIGSSSQYILRSGVPGDVDDSAITPGIKPYYNAVALNAMFDDNVTTGTPGVSDIGNGVYIVTMAGCPANASGSFVNNSYLLTKSQFDSLRTELSTSSYTGIDPLVDDITTNVAKVLINPFQYVINCFYIPMSASRLAISGTVEHIRYGWYNLSSQGLVLVNPIVVKTLYDGALFKHPAYNATNLNMYTDSRWINYSIDCRVIGHIGIPNDPLTDADHIAIYCTIDVTTGDVVIWCQPSANGSSVGFERFTLAKQNWGIAIPLSSYLRDPTSAQSSTLGAVNSALNIGKDLLTLDIGGALTDLTQGITSAKTAGARAKAATVQTTGGVGSFAALAYPTNGLIAEYHIATNLTGSYSARLGCLTLKQATISSVSTLPDGSTKSLIMCKDPVLGVGSINNINWTSDEYNEILNYMRTGFYYV